MYDYYDDEGDWNGFYKDNFCTCCEQLHTHCECFSCEICHESIYSRTNLCCSCQIVVRIESENEEEQFKHIFQNLDIDYFKKTINETNINNVNKNGNNLLDLFVKYRKEFDYEVPIFLIESGININEEDRCFERFACINNIETCKMIMDRISQRPEIKKYYTKEIKELILTY